MLVHHGTQDYNVAASAAADRARAKFESTIENGRARAAAVLHQIDTQQPTDRIVKGSALSFIPAEKGVLLSFPDKSNTVEPLHRHAMGQAAARVKIPMAYVDTLADRNEPWANELLAKNLNELYHHHSEAKYLTRSVNGEVRGFLSDAYRRLDARPIVASFIEKMQQFGAVPIEGFALDTKVSISCVLPMVFEPVAGEVMIYGTCFETSDFGKGFLRLWAWIRRLWCTNDAMISEDLKKVHIGGRLDENLKLSQKTYALDTETMASAVADISGNIMSSAAVNQYMKLIEASSQDSIQPGRIGDFLKKNLLKGEVDAVNQAFNSADVEMLPPGNTSWRLSNAISWIAGKTENEERRLELQQLAGAVIEKGVGAKAAKAEADIPVIEPEYVGVA